MSRTILVTRHPADCRPLADALRPHGVAVRPYPVMVVRDVGDERGWRLVRGLLEAPPGAVWVALASPRAPDRLVREASARGLGRLLEAPVAAIGSATAAAASAAGLEPALVADGDGASLASALIAELPAAATVVLACGRHRRRELPAALERAGHRVVPVAVYDMAATPPRELPPLPASLDAVVVTSPRAARLYLDGVGGLPLPCTHWALGPTTRDAAAALGIACRIPPRPEMEALASALLDSFDAEPDREDTPR